MSLGDAQMPGWNRDGRSIGELGSGGGRQFSGFVSGEIISKDDGNITIKLPDGGSRIIFYSSSTAIEMFVTGSAENLLTGKMVSVNGTSSGDGSVVARSIQLRPEAEIRPIETR